jgi:hypothetical protein
VTTTDTLTRDDSISPALRTAAGDTITLATADPGMALYQVSLANLGATAQSVTFTGTNLLDSLTISASFTVAATGTFTTLSLPSSFNAVAGVQFTTAASLLLDNVVAGLPVVTATAEAQGTTAGSRWATSRDVQFNTDTLSFDLVSAGADLSGSFNRTGIVNDGSTFSSTGGLDGVGNALSANLLGTSLTWNNTTFALGAAGANNVIAANGQTLALPQGQYASLRFLAAAVNGKRKARPSPSPTLTAPRRASLRASAT